MNYIESLMKYSRLSRTEAIEYAVDILVSSNTIPCKEYYDDKYIENITTEMCERVDSMLDKLALLNQRDKARFNMLDLNPIEVYHFCERMTNTCELYALITGFGVEELKTLVFSGTGAMLKIISRYPINQADEFMDDDSDVNCLSIYINKVGIGSGGGLRVDIRKYDSASIYRSSIDAGPLSLVRQSVSDIDIYDVLMEESTRENMELLMTVPYLPVNEHGMLDVDDMKLVELTKEQVRKLAINFRETYSFGRNAKQIDRIV